MVAQTRLGTYGCNHRKLEISAGVFRELFDIILGVYKSCAAPKTTRSALPQLHEEFWCKNVHND